MPIRVTLPLQGNATITIEGEIDYIKDTIGHVKELAEALGSEVGILTTMPPVVITKPTSTIPMKAKSITPTIPADKKGVLRDTIASLFDSEWGAVPRSFSEIRDVLAANAIFRDRGSIAGTLFQLVEANRIRRHKDTNLNQWAYTKY